MNVAVLVLDSVTKLPREADGAVVVGGSHGAVYAAHLSAKAGVRAAIHHDAGIGLDEAGVSGLGYAESLGMAMVALATESCRIGDGRDQYERGLVSRVNAPAALCGVTIGMTCRDAVELLKAAHWPHRPPAPKGEDRHLVGDIVCVDSASLLLPEDKDRVVATGSHAALNSGHATAPARPRLIFFNDAGPGIDDGGILGLSVLEEAGVAGVAVAARSARIGDGRSTLQDGTISAFNHTAYRLGARAGRSALALARAVAEKAGRKEREEHREWPSST
ncbi:hypothetical protein SAMN02745126_04141 [Enhydrobacter aerosaccus]|uniref:Uncharacterized protein n=1 Tax=Enhydrobacter aerosaccus TaxID=225324 RepID=A0A1T4RXV3_9HYPH|nr:hypothetical protein [Enhydrobacter aerosaccus]SKA20757.1 hypothetical protein SAMN02745126_04141 [Enhydrobacter aerosaccus]